MPEYTFKNKETGEEHDAIMKIAEMETYLKDNPNLETVLKNMNLVDPYSVGRMKTDSVFNERLKTIKKNNPGNTINTGNLTTI